MIERIPRSEILKKLALVNVIAGSLKLDLEDDLTDEDIAAGAEPLSREQIQNELERICMIVTEIAIQQLRAENEEWYAVNDQIE